MQFKGRKNCAWLQLQRLSVLNAVLIFYYVDFNYYSLPE